MFMRFLISVIDDELGTGTPEEMSAIDVFNDNLRAEGYWVIAVGIASPRSAITIDNRLGVGLIESGSTLYRAEYQSGFWLIDVPDEQTARDLAHAGSQACNRIVELRPLLD